MVKTSTPHGCPPFPFGRLSLSSLVLKLPHAESDDSSNGTKFGHEQGHLRPPEKEDCNDDDVLHGDLDQEMLTWNGDHLSIKISCPSRSLVFKYLVHQGPYYSNVSYIKVLSIQIFNHLENQGPRYSTIFVRHGPKYSTFFYQGSKHPNMLMIH